MNRQIGAQEKENSLDSYSQKHVIQGKSGKLDKIDPKKKRLEQGILNFKKMYIMNLFFTLPHVYAKISHIHGSSIRFTFILLPRGQINEC